MTEIKYYMKKVKVGDTVTATLFGGKEVTGEVEGIEICARGSKYGRQVSSCDLDKHSNGVIELSTNNWCYFNQVRQINDGED